MLNSSIGIVCDLISHTGGNVVVFFIINDMKVCNKLMLKDNIMLLLKKTYTHYVSISLRFNVGHLK